MCWHMTLGTQWRRSFWRATSAGAQREVSPVGSRRVLCMEAGCLLLAIFTIADEFLRFCSCSKQNSLLATRALMFSQR